MHPGMRRYQPQLTPHGRHMTAAITPSVMGPGMGPASAAKTSIDNHPTADSAARRAVATSTPPAANFAQPTSPRRPRRGAGADAEGFDYEAEVQRLLLMPMPLPRAPRGPPSVPLALSSDAEPPSGPRDSRWSAAVFEAHGYIVTPAQVPRVPSGTATITPAAAVPPELERVGRASSRPAHPVAAPRMPARAIRTKSPTATSARINLSSF
jgi:hypothetical protein